LLPQLHLNSLDRLLQIVQQQNINVEGLHIHTGSDIEDIEVFIKGIEVLFESLP
jgi:diaminopimelate decarboxylase